MIFWRFWIEIKFKIDNIHFLLLTLSSNNGHPLQRVDLTLELIIELIMQFRKYHKTATHLKSSMSQNAWSKMHTVKTLIMIVI